VATFEQRKEAWSALQARFATEPVTGFVLVADNHPRFPTVAAAESAKSKVQLADPSSVEPMEVVEDRKEVVLVRRIVSSPASKACGSELPDDPQPRGWDDGLNLTFAVRREALVPLVKTPRSQRFPDGTGFGVAAGAGIRLLGDATPAVSVRIEDGAIQLPLDGFDLGLSYGGLQLPPSPPAHASTPHHVGKPSAVGRYWPTNATVGSRALRTPASIGSCDEQGLCRWARDGCATLDAIVADRTPVTPSAGNVGVAISYSRCRTVEAKKGTTLYWRDGSVAGSVVVEKATLSGGVIRVFSDQECPTEVEGRTCFRVKPYVSRLCADTHELLIASEPK
jgi:hypothetical protein